MKIYLTFFLLLFNLSLIAQEISNKKIVQIQKILENYVKKTNAPGLSVIIKKKDFTYKKGLGYADINSKLKSTIYDSYKIASVTKPMTAVAILQLYEKGLIDLNDEIQKYVPQFPQKRYPVTIKDLLSHTSGVSHYKHDREKHFKKHKNTEESIDIFKDWKLVMEPGDKFSYTSYGYILLGALIENVSNMSYGDYMEKYIWGLSEMDNTSLDNPEIRVTNQVSEYSLSWFGNVKKAEKINISSRFSAGGVRSTVSDLLKFSESLQSFKLLKPRMMKIMLTPVISMKGNHEYSLGWNTKPILGRQVVFHSGGMPQTSAHLMIVPSENITIALCSNLGRQILQNMAFDILDILLKDG